MKPGGLMAVLMSAKKSSKPMKGEEEDESSEQEGSDMEAAAGDELTSSLGLSGGKAKAFLSALKSYIECCGGDD